MSLTAALAVAMGTACFGERERPAPPLIELLPDRTTVRSPDELRVTVRAYDPDGMDSVWLKVDGREEGLDGLLRTSFEARLAMTIQSGHSPGTNVELRVRARDLSGFTDTLWDTVTVIP